TRRKVARFCFGGEILIPRSSKTMAIWPAKVVSKGRAEIVASGRRVVHSFHVDARDGAVSGGPDQRRTVKPEPPRDRSHNCQPQGQPEQQLVMYGTKHD